jgi:hypothetical protein
MSSALRSAVEMTRAKSLSSSGSARVEDFAKNKDDEIKNREI